MALTPDTEKALADALSAVIDECGDDPKYGDLVDALTAAQHALPAEHDGSGDHPADEPAADDSAPTDNFDEAKRRFMKKRQAPQNEPGVAA